MKYSEKFRMVSDYILDHFHLPECTVDSICDELHLSRSTLHRVIKSGSGLSATGFINTLRLQMGYSLLAKKKDNIKNIAIQVGFKDPKYFSRLFKQMYGLSPQQLLQEVKTKEEEPAL